MCVYSWGAGLKKSLKNNFDFRNFFVFTSYFFGLHTDVIKSAFSSSVKLIFECDNYLRSALTDWTYIHIRCPTTCWTPCITHYKQLKGGGYFLNGFVYILAWLWLIHFVNLATQNFSIIYSFIFINSPFLNFIIPNFSSINE